MKRSGKRRFQTLGMRMLQFSRRIITDYIPSGDLAEADDMASEWSSDTDMPDAFQHTFEPEPVGDGPTYVPPPTSRAAPPRPVEPAEPRQPPTPAQPAAPKPAVQRKPASSGESKLDPRLLRILEAHQQVEAERNVIREQKKALFNAPPADAQRSSDEPSGTQPRRRGRGSASFDYVETGSLKQGMEDDMPPAARPPTPVEDTGDEGGAEAAMSEAVTASDMIQRAEAIEPSDITDAPPTETDYADISENIVQRSPEPTQYEDVPETDLEEEFPEDDLEAFERLESPVADSPAPEVVQRAPQSYPTSETAPEFEAEVENPYIDEVEPDTNPDTPQNWQAPMVADAPVSQTIQRTIEPADFEEEPTYDEYSGESFEAEVPAPSADTIQRSEQPNAPAPTMRESDSDYNEPQEWVTEVYSPEQLQRAIDYSANTIEYPEDQEWVTEYDPYGDYTQPEDDAYAESASYDNDFGAQDAADSPAPRPAHIQREIYDNFPTDIVGEHSAPGAAAQVDFGDMSSIQRAPEYDMPAYEGDPEFFTNFGAPQEAEVEAQADDDESEDNQPELEYIDGDDPFFDQPTEIITPNWAKQAPSNNAPADTVQRDYQAPDNGEYDDYAQPSDNMFQQTDLYSAMVESGMIPPSPADTHDVSPHIQRYPETSTGDTDSSNLATDPSEIHSTPDSPRSLEDDLMGLLDMRPPTPNKSASEIQRDTAVSYGQSPEDSSTFGSGVNYTSSDQIQRAVTIDEMSTSTTNEEGSSGEGGDVDVEKLARDVFSALRNRLRIERERRHKN